MIKITKSTCLTLALLSALSWQASFAATPDVLEQEAVHSSVAPHAVLLDIARAGDRLVAVGERGIILLSDDNGNSWHQSQVPVSVTLTSVQFVNAVQGWVVGHSGVVLHSSDAGEHWQLQLDGNKAAALELAAAEQLGDPERLRSSQQLAADGADKPLLALHFSNEREGLVVGAYGLAFHTLDGGHSWQSWIERLPNTRGLHLYAIGQVGTAIYLAGEQGLFIRSLDGGEHFEKLATPYEGSFFSLDASSEHRLIIGGLRGRLFVSEDSGSSFTVLENPQPVSVSTIRHFGQRLAIVNQAGTVLLADGVGQQLQALPAMPRAPSTSIIEAADGTLVAVGFAGAQRLSRSNP